MIHALQGIINERFENVYNSEFPKIYIIIIVIMIILF